MKEKTNKFNKITIISIVSLILIIIVIIFVINIYREKKTSVKNMEIIKNNYSELSANVTDYNKIRENLSGKLNNFTYENFPKEYEDYNELLKSYNDNIEKIDNNISNINSKCNNIYNDISVNKICDSYKTLYEKIINLYVIDLTNYNNKVISYNEYTNNNIEVFKLMHEDYIDYNEDSVYEGKNIENEEDKEEK